LRLARRRAQAAPREEGVSAQNPDDVRVAARFACIASRYPARRIAARSPDRQDDDELLGSRRLAAEVRRVDEAVRAAVRAARAQPQIDDLVIARLAERLRDLDFGGPVDLEERMRLDRRRVSVARRLPGTTVDVRDATLEREQQDQSG